MPRAAPVQSSFNSGEVSPLFSGRAETDRYKAALKTCQNYLPLVPGALTRRPGTKYVAATKSNGIVRLIDYQISDSESFMLEFGEDYIRFFKDYSPIVSMMSPYEVTTSYQEEDLDTLCFVPTPGGLYILHPFYPPKILIHIADDNWSFASIAFVDGPYIPQNTTATTLTPDATSGNVTITASAATGINEGAGFTSDDVGRLIRIKHTGWSWFKITAINSTTSVEADVMSTSTTASGSAEWRLGLWGETHGYPACGCFYEDRLVLAGGNTLYPLRIDMSQTGEYFDFSPSETDGTVLPTSGLSFSLISNRTNYMRWLLAHEKGLLAGTASGEWRIRAAVDGEALSAANPVNARPATGYGSAPIQPLSMGSSAIFVSKNYRRVREMSFSFDTDGFNAPDRTLIADHITGETGLRAVARQVEPFSILWGVRYDGVLVSMSYEHDADSLIIGWARHVIGGVSSSDLQPAIVESVAVMPSSDGLREDVWIVVQRLFSDGMGGTVTKRYIEYITRIFDDSVDQRDAFFVDSGLTYDNPIAITGISTSTITVTSAAHGLVNGDSVWLTDIVGMSDLNNHKFTVRDKTTDTFQLDYPNGDAVVGAQIGIYVSGGHFRKYVSTLSGLGHMTGALGVSLGIYADGAVQTGTILPGASTLSLTTPATTVHVGINYNSDGQRLRDEAGAADGTAMGKNRRTNRVSFLVHRTLGFFFGMDFDTMNQVYFRKANAQMNAPVALYSGMVSEELDADYDMENQVCWRQNTPQPGTILAVAPQVVVQDRS